MKVAKYVFRSISDEKNIRKVKDADDFFFLKNHRDIYL